MLRKIGEDSDFTYYTRVGSLELTKMRRPLLFLLILLLQCYSEVHGNSFDTETFLRFGCGLYHNFTGCGNIQTQSFDSSCLGPYLCKATTDCTSCPGNPLARYYVNVRDYPATDESDPVAWKVYFPSNCTNCPVMYFGTTTTLTTDIDNYDIIMEQMVSWGMVVVGFYNSDPIPPIFSVSTLAERLDPIMDYVRNGGLAADMAPFSSSPRLDKVIYGGHGQGARVMLQRMVDNSCQGSIFGGVSCECEGGTIGGIVMLSPVEDTALVNIDVGNGVILQDNKQAAWTAPALLITGGLDAEPADSGIPPCAPEAISDDHFYNNWEGPIWAINFKNFGHHDLGEADADGDLCFRTDVISDFAKNPLPLITPYLTEFQKINLYRRSIASFVRSFVDGILNENYKSFEALQTSLPSSVALDVYGAQDLRLSAKKQNVPSNVVTAGIEAKCVVSPRLFSDEVQILVNVTFAGVVLGIVAGVPLLYYYKIYKPQKEFEKKLPTAIQVELKDENLMMTKVNNPTFQNVQTLSPQMTPPPGMDDGLSQVSSIARDEDNVIPYDPTSVRMSTMPKDDDIF